jgi:hypothetical protein
VSNGFSIITGTGATVTIDSDDTNVPGILLDQFTVAYTGSETRTYSAFPGAAIFAMTYVTTAGKVNAPQITINNSTKTITVACPTVARTLLQTGVLVMVMGR